MTSDRVVLVGENDSAESTDTIVVVPTATGGSEITYTADLEMKGAAKLAAPAMKARLREARNDTEEQLSQVLNSRG